MKSTTIVTRSKPAKPKPLSKESLWTAMWVLKWSVKDLVKHRRVPSLRRDLKEQIAALREVSRCYFATAAKAEERRAA